jgi:anti-sigma regulatory factor (Ser/Thr protein kinase)
MHRKIELPPVPASIRKARQFVSSACRHWKIDDDTCDDACLVVNELVANVVDHARTPCVVTIALDPGGLRISVEDANAGSLPTLRPLDVTARRGRGLQMIAALSTACGVRVRAAGKAVWAQLSTGPPTGFAPLSNTG